MTYVDEAGHTVKTDTISGNVGDSGHYTAKVPSGYELAAGQSAETAYTLSSGTNTMTIKLQKKAVTPTKTPAVLKVDYIDENGNVVTTDTVSGHVGDTGTYSATAPSGYVLGNGQDATVSYTLGQTTNTLTISVQRQPAIVTVKYVNGDGTVVGTKNITGRVGDQVDLSESVPDGYKLEDNPIGSHYTLTGNQTAVTLKVVSVDQTPTSLITVQTPQDVSTAPILPRALWL
ncbi:MucBP domain-containing protein [Secundilactobacillus kimchicus]|uniref:MucBP domain-containing protein n=1 Tax=Secundilactobacillus kimchicus TaxID=528209 RepID=UPI0006E21F04|nr:MucBP domain-containing protein [Secundilactobacillus kimchicus]